MKKETKTNPEIIGQIDKSDELSDSEKTALQKYVQKLLEDREKKSKVNKTTLSL